MGISDDARGQECASSGNGSACAGCTAVVWLVWLPKKRPTSSFPLAPRKVTLQTQNFPREHPRCSSGRAPDGLERAPVVVRLRTSGEKRCPEKRVFLLLFLSRAHIQVIEDRPFERGDRQ